MQSKIASGTINFVKTFTDSDCYEVKQTGQPLPGVYTLRVDSGITVAAYCEVDGWTIIQSRGQFNNANDYFYKTWQQYQVGFGVPGT